MAPTRGWYTDPSGKFAFRYWSGAAWTEHVRNGDVIEVDPVPGDVATQLKLEIQKPAAVVADPEHQQGQTESHWAISLLIPSEMSPGRRAEVVIAPARVAPQGRIRRRLGWGASSRQAPAPRSAPRSRGRIRRSIPGLSRSL